MKIIPETWTYAEAAEKCKCDRFAIRTAVENGIIKAYKPGRIVQLDKQSVIDWYFKSGESLVKTRPRRKAW